MKKGYVHIYTGDGKGKTTAALGLSLRAVCANKKVYFAQFMKGQDYAELDAHKYLPNFTLKQYGSKEFIIDKPTQNQIDLANEGLFEVSEILKSNEYDIVVLDELNMALYFNLFSIEKVLDILDNRNKSIEVIITGRRAPQELIDYADLVSEIKEVKHYYNQGVIARKGIEY